MNHILEFNNYVECDGCQYFDFQSLKRYFPGYENPLYSLLWKKTIEELIYISPQEYIENIAKGFKTTVDYQFNLINNKLVNKYIDDFKNGDKFPIIYYTENRSEQEGRHRAMAMLKMNIKKIPVIRKEYVSDIYIKSIFNKIKNMNRDEVNQYFINKNYNGITDLDWRELKNYIEYH